MSNSLTSYPSDVSDEEWAFVAPYLTLMREDAPQRDHTLRAVFNALRWMARAGAGWRLLPHDFPPWPAVYQQTQRWLRARVFEAMAHDLRALLRLAAGRDAAPTAAILDSRTLQSSVESGGGGGGGGGAGDGGAKRKRGSKVHLAVDTLGHLLALHVTPADVQDPAARDALAPRGPEATGDRGGGPPWAPSPRGGGRPRATVWRWRTWTKGTPANSPPRTRRPTASRSKSLSCPRRSAASCCCRGAGGWSAIWPGRRASGGWYATTSGCRAHWLGCISSPSPPSCSNGL